MMIDIGAFNLVALLILVVPLSLLRRRGHSAGHLVCLSLFFFYLWAVASYVIFPLHLDAEYIDMMRQHREWVGYVNLIPLAFGESGVRSVQVYGNFLLGVPLGFGLPLVLSATPGRVVRLGLCFAAGLELLQLIISLFYGFPYRVIDINDVLLVFSGVIFGQLGLQVLARGYERIVGPAATSGPLGSHVHSVLIGIRRGSPRVPATRG